MAIVKTVLFMVVVVGSVTVGVPCLLLSCKMAWSSYEMGMFRWLGVPPMAVGAACWLRCAWDFAFHGRGTPAPIDPPKVLVARGPYRVVRNPMYVSVGLVLVGEALLFESLILLVYALLLGLGFHLFVVCYEEPTLRRKFGAAYEEYCRAVPRWIPEVRRRPRRGSGVRERVKR